MLPTPAAAHATIKNKPLPHKQTQRDNNTQVIAITLQLSSRHHASVAWKTLAGLTMCPSSLPLGVRQLLLLLFQSLHDLGGCVHGRRCTGQRPRLGRVKAARVGMQHLPPGLRPLGTRGREWAGACPTRPASNLQHAAMAHDKVLGIAHKHSWVRIDLEPLQSLAIRRNMCDAPRTQPAGDNFLPAIRRRREPRLGSFHTGARLRCSMSEGG